MSSKYYKNFAPVLKDGAKIFVDVPHSVDKVKRICQFEFSTEDKTCEFVSSSSQADIVVRGYPTRRSLAGLEPYRWLDGTDTYFAAYEKDFLSVLSTDIYDMPSVGTIWIPSTLQKIARAIAAGCKNIHVYDINKNTLRFCELIIERRVDEAIDMIVSFGKMTSPISAPVEKKVRETLATSASLPTTLPNITFHQLDILEATEPLDDVIDVSNIFVFPRTIWLFDELTIREKFQLYPRAFGWTPDFTFREP